MRLLLILCMFSGLAAVAAPVGNKIPADKILVLFVDDAGFVSDGRDTINTDDLAEYIQERLFKNYSGTGKMYDKIKLKKSSENVPTPVMEIVLKEITTGQKAALAEMCLHKFKKYFDELTKKQQQKLKKQFPVLFQSSFT